MSKIFDENIHDVDLVLGKAILNELTEAPPTHTHTHIPSPSVPQSHRRRFLTPSPLTLPPSSSLPLTLPYIPLLGHTQFGANADGSAEIPVPRAEQY